VFVIKEVALSENLDIVAEVSSGMYRGARMRQRFFRDRENQNDWSKFLKFFLTLFHDMYEEVDGKKVLKSPINEKSLVGKKFVADVVEQTKEMSGKTFMNLANFRSEDFEIFQDLSPSDLDAQESDDVPF
jgi:hypothetical protein